MLDFDRAWCARGDLLKQREWLVTNGIGGYACGTVAGALARHYHGLLVAAMEPPLGRTLLLSKLNETLIYRGQQVALYTDQWADGTISPTGYTHLERFHLEGTTPVWTFRVGDALLEKRVWMEYGHNTTWIQYVMVQSSEPLQMQVDVLVNYRDHHGSTVARDWFMTVLPQADGLCVGASSGAVPFWVRSDRAEIHPDHTWSTGYFKAIEQYRGEPNGDDHLYAGAFRVNLNPGETVGFVATTEETANTDLAAAWQRRQTYEANIIKACTGADQQPMLRQLALAADQFIVRRTVQGMAEGKSVLAGYPWFSDWGRDTMIALSGLTLATGRPAVAAKILRTFAQFVSQGMIPNRFPDVGETPEYNTVDASLWYFEAVRSYHAATADLDLVQELYPTLQDMIRWHLRGTRYQIHVDPADGLLYAGEPGAQLTWMDVRIDDWVVTPRTGKPVEINALWYNALQVMAALGQLLDQPVERYVGLAEQVRASFQRFWNAEVGYCFDVIDGPAGNDATLRPNQVLAASLTDDLLSGVQRTSMMQIVEQKLLTPYGLRSLTPDHSDYHGSYGGPRRVRDAAYHQGTVWAWLIGPFVEAHFRLYQDTERVRQFIEPLLEHLAAQGIGSVSEIFDGDPPHMPRGCFAQAWSVGELLRVWRLIT